jgi:hypothetical protein
MNGEALQARDQLVAAYLQQMQELAREITASMDAIAANAIPQFQESVARQEMLCSSLVAMAGAVGKGFHSSEQSLPSGKGTEAELRIRAASKAIRELNCGPAPALQQVNCCSYFVVQKLFRTISGGPRPQVEASDLVLRDVSHVSIYLTVYSCASIECRFRRNADNQQQYLQCAHDRLHPGGGRSPGGWVNQ